jgi:hypothetical protein
MCRPDEYGDLMYSQLIIYRDINQAYNRITQDIVFSNNLLGRHPPVNTAYVAVEIPRSGEVSRPKKLRMCGIRGTQVV